MIILFNNFFSDIASGGSDDWMKAVAHIPLSFTLELPDTDTYGFVLPPSYIRPTSTQIIAALHSLEIDLLRAK